MKTPIHPGEVLADELEALKLSAAELARRIHVPTNRVTQIINGARSVSADTALRLGRFSAPRPCSGSTSRNSTSWIVRPCPWATR